MDTEMARTIGNLKCIYRSKNAELAIVFVHGLDGHWKETWRHSDLNETEEFGWPEWLGKDLSRAPIQADVYSFAYPAASSGWRGKTLPVFDRAGQFKNILENDLNSEVPIFFICHSLGGIIAKRLLRICDTYGDPSGICSRTRALMFLGTPHVGSRVAWWTKWLPKIARRTVTLQELEENSPELVDLRFWFVEKCLKVYNWEIKEFSEGRDTVGLRIVGQSSAWCGIAQPVATDEDHISLPKMPDEDHQVYKTARKMAFDAARNNLKEANSR